MRFFDWLFKKKKEDEIKKCICGGLLVKEFSPREDVKIYLCPLCAYMIMRQNIEGLTNKKDLEKIIGMMVRSKKK